MGEMFLGNIKGKDGVDGKTPVKGVDYWTEAEQEAIVQQVIAALGTPVFGTVDTNNNIILTGELVDGTYTIKYEDADGQTVDIGSLELSLGPVEIPLTWEYGAALDKATGEVSSTGSTSYSASDYVAVDSNKTYTLTRDSYMYNSCNLIWYDANDNFISYVELPFTSINASGGSSDLSYQFTPPANAAKFRLRLWYETTQDAETIAAMYKLVKENSGTEPTYTNILEKIEVQLNKRWSKTAAAYVDCPGMITFTIPWADVKSKTVRLKGFTPNLTSSTQKSSWYWCDTNDAHCDVQFLYKDEAGMSHYPNNIWETTNLLDEGNGVYAHMFIRANINGYDSETAATLKVSMPVKENTSVTEEDLDGLVITIDEPIE